MSEGNRLGATLPDLPDGRREDSGRGRTAAPARGAGADGRTHPSALPPIDRESEQAGALATALGLHEGISTPEASEGLFDPVVGGCKRWPEHLRLLSSQGELVRGRCRATNQCTYCARLAAVENTELLALDALHGEAPQVWACLGTRTASADPKRFYASRRKVQVALERRWEGTEYAALVEFTTGYGPRSGGKRRPHWNLLLKGIPAGDVDQARDVITRVWCAREDALAKYQYVGTIGEARGLMAYLALHFQKESQAPPKGWRGHRFMHSHGYLWLPTKEAREVARRGLRLKRELHRAEARGLSGWEAELEARAARKLAENTTWELHQLHATATGDGEPASQHFRRFATARQNRTRAPQED